MLNTKVYDEVIRVKEADSGPVSKQVNQLDGIPVGISSGAAIWTALQLANTYAASAETTNVAQVMIATNGCTARYLAAKGVPSLRREVSILKEERDILKKAAAYFAKHAT